MAVLIKEQSLYFSEMEYNTRRCEKFKSSSSRGEVASLNNKLNKFSVHARRRGQLDNPDWNFCATFLSLRKNVDVRLQSPQTFRGTGVIKRWNKDKFKTLFLYIGTR